MFKPILSIVFGLITLIASHSASADPLSCEERRGFRGSYQVYIDNQKSTKEAILTVLKELHFTGVGNSTNSGIEILSSYAVTRAHIIHFTIGDYRSKDESALRSRERALNDLIVKLVAQPGVDVDCDVIMDGGVIESN